MKRSELAKRGAMCWAALIMMVVLASPAVGNWMPETRLTTAPHASYLSGNNARCLVADPAGMLHLVWFDYRDGDSEIYYRRFDGVAWGAETALTHNTTPSVDPTVAVDSGGGVHVVWIDQLGGNPRLYHKAFDGSSWSPAIPVAEASLGCESPSIAADDLGRLHLVWRDYDGNWGVFYSMFDGITWSDSLKISDPAGYPLQPSIACDDSQHVHVVWDDYRHTNWEIYYVRFDGTVWEPAVRLTNDTGMSENPSVIADSEGNIHVFWDDDRGGLSQFDIYQKTYDGITWSADIKIADAVANAVAPSVSAGTGGTIQAVWYDFPGGNTDVYSMAFDGIAWGDVERLTAVSAISKNPMTAVDSDGLVHAVWHDRRDGNYEIYWRVRGVLPKPELTSIQPDSGYAYTVTEITNLAGTGFVGDAAVWLRRDGEEDIQADNEAIITSSRITCDLDLTGASLGLWDVVVQNIDLQRDTLFEAFRVIPLLPTEVTSIDPANGTAYQEVHITEISGLNFALGSTVRLEMAGEDSIDAINVSVESGASISCDFVLTGAEAGAWDVVVESPDGQTGTLPDGFTVFPSPWDQDLRLTYDSAESNLPKPNARAIAVDGQGNLHVVWSDLRDGNLEIYYKLFDGAVWSADQRLTTADGGSANPAIAIDGSDNPHVVWDDYRDGDYEIYYKYYNGTAWSADERVTDAEGVSRYPSLAIGSDDNIHLTWQDDRPGGDQYAYYRMRVGSSWLGEHIVADGVASSGTPAIAVDSNNHAHIVWYQDHGATERLLHRKFDGYTWNETYVITDSRNVYGPTVAIDDSNWVHVAWHDQRYIDNYEVFYKRYNGIDWGTDNRVTDAPGISSNASVVVDDSGYVHLAWRDQREGDAQIYYSRKEGDTWVVQTRLTLTPGESAHPSLALAPDGACHMVWRDHRDGNYEIYYKTRASWGFAAIDDRTADSGPIANLRVLPNPVRLSTGPSARIQFTLGFKTRPVLSVYEVTGRLVRRIDAGEMEPGLQQITWDGKGAAGGPVAQGFYFIEVSTATTTASTKVIVLR